MKRRKLLKRTVLHGRQRGESTEEKELQSPDLEPTQRAKENPSPAPSDYPIASLEALPAYFASHPEALEAVAERTNALIQLLRYVSETEAPHLDQSYIDQQLHAINSALKGLDQSRAVSPRRAAAIILAIQRCEKARAFIAKHLQLSTPRVAIDVVSKSATHQIMPQTLSIPKSLLRKLDDVSASSAPFLIPKLHLPSRFPLVISPLSVDSLWRIFVFMETLQSRVNESKKAQDPSKQVDKALTTLTQRCQSCGLHFTSRTGKMTHLETHISLRLLWSSTFLPYANKTLGFSCNIFRLSQSSPTASSSPMKKLLQICRDFKQMRPPRVKKCCQQELQNMYWAFPKTAAESAYSNLVALTARPPPIPAKSPPNEGTDKPLRPRSRLVSEIATGRPSLQNFPIGLTPEYVGYMDVFGCVICGDPLPVVSTDTDEASLNVFANCEVFYYGHQGHQAASNDLSLSQVNLESVNRLLEVRPTFLCLKPYRAHSCCGQRGLLPNRLKSCLSMHPTEQVDIARGVLPRHLFIAHKACAQFTKYTITLADSSRDEMFPGLHLSTTRSGLNRF